MGFNSVFKGLIGLLQVIPRRSKTFIWALWRFHKSQIGSPTFRFNLSVSSTRVKQSNWTTWDLKMGPIGRSETSVRNYCYTIYIYICMSVSKRFSTLSDT